MIFLIRSSAIFTVHAFVLNMVVSFGRFFLNVFFFLLYTVKYIVIFSCLEPSVKMCEYLGYFFNFLMVGWV